MALVFHQFRAHHGFASNFLMTVLKTCTNLETFHLSSVRIWRSPVTATLIKKPAGKYGNRGEPKSVALVVIPPPAAAVKEEDHVVEEGQKTKIVELGLAAVEINDKRLMQLLVRTASPDVASYPPE